MTAFATELQQKKGKNFISMDSEYIKPTYFMDYEHPAVKALKNQILSSYSSQLSHRQLAVAFYQFVRDHYWYNAFNLKFDPATFQSSYVTGQKDGNCIHKAVLLASLCRSEQIPARLGFSDVRNHLSTEKMDKMFGHNIYVFHGYAELYIDQQWFKVTPAFNKELCERLNVEPLEFDGKSDALFQQFNRGQKKFMDYVNDRGIFSDFPYQDFVDTLQVTYPNLFHKT